MSLECNVLVLRCCNDGIWARRSIKAKWFQRRSQGAAIDIGWRRRLRRMSKRSFICFCSLEPAHAISSAISYPGRDGSVAGGYSNEAGASMNYSPQVADK